MMKRLETGISLKVEGGLHAHIGGRTTVWDAAWSVSLFGNRTREEGPLFPEAVQERKDLL